MRVRSDRGPAREVGEGRAHQDVAAPLTREQGHRPRESRGGYDALSLLPPLTGSAASAYLAQRPILAIRPGGLVQPVALPGVSAFGLHPKLQPLAPFYQAGNMAIVQKVGLPDVQLSHFKAKQIMSLGRADLLNPDPRGWLGRLSDTYFSNALDIVGVGVTNRVDLVANTVKPIVINTLSNFDVPVLYNNYADSVLRRDIFNQIVSQVFPGEHRITDAARQATDRGFDLSEVVQAATDPITLQGTYPANEPLGASLQNIAKMIRGSLGTRIFYTATGGFDTHGGQETAGAGGKPTLTQRLDRVVLALTGFISDIQSNPSRWSDTAIVVFTEFGRRNYENQTAGTDHGRGFHALVLGGSIQGGLKGNTVTAADIQADNLPVQIDYRTLFWKCIQDWLQLNPQPLFDFTPGGAEPPFTLF
jgi:uncharacterized protein (DUF1501 family)